MNRTPYPGLRSFQIDETDIFFGREEHTDQLLKKLGDTHFLAVVGPSGCGKSSLVYTGMLAGLESGFLADAGVRWCVVALRPGNEPFARLAEVLLTEAVLGPTYPTQFTDKTENLAILQAQLHRGPFSLQELLTEAQLPVADTNLLLVIDQFEELFRYHQQGSPDEAAAFVSLLLKSSQHPQIYVVITMRSDFLGDCAIFYGLPEAINRGLFLTPRLTREQLRAAIVGPAQVFNGEIEAQLVTYLLNDLGNDPDQLPLLQHVLMRMWTLTSQRVLPTGEAQVLLTLSDYERLGKLKYALSNHLEEVYATFTAPQQHLVKILFTNLSERSRTRRDTRRPLQLEQIAHLTAVPWSQVAEIVEVFREEGRRFLTPRLEDVPHLEPHHVLDISHESLIRQWQRLQTWLTQEFETAELYCRLENAARRWEQGQAALWQTPELEIALAWRQTTQPTIQWATRYGSQFDLAMRFLVTSETQQQAKQQQAETSRQHELKQLRHQIFWALIGLTGAVGLAIWGYWERTEAIHAQQRTEQARQQAILAQQQTKWTEQSRTLNLFESQLTHAELLAHSEDYTKAKNTLNKTLELNTEVKAERRHTRNLLSWFSKLMGGVAQEVYPEAGVPLLAVAVAADGQRLAAAGEKGTLVLFDVTTGRLQQRLQGHTDHVRAVVFHPQDQQLISAGKDKQIIIWSLLTNTSKKWEAPDQVLALAISPDGKYLASGGSDNNITLWDVGSGQQLRTFRGHENSISGLVFSPSGELLASAAYDGTARLWQVKSGQALHTLTGPTGPIQSVAFSPDEKLLASSSDNNIRLWQVMSGEPLQVLQGHQNTVFKVRFTANGRYLVSSSRDNTLRLWDPDSGVTMRVLHSTIKFLAAPAE